MIDSFIEGNKIFLEKDFERKKERYMQLTTSQHRPFSGLDVLIHVCIRSVLLTVVQGSCSLTEILEILSRLMTGTLQQFLSMQLIT